MVFVSNVIRRPQIKTIKDNVEYYISESCNADFNYDDECIYDDLDLDAQPMNNAATAILASSPGYHDSL